MATRTWKIGEYAKGGVITVETTKNAVTVIGKDWDYSAGSSRGSSQTNAKEWTRKCVGVNESDARWKLNLFLNDLTSSYYADQILKWIESKVKLNKMPWEE